ncbi:hypothetical protein [Romboutsia weinsteinii]|nr:hypothetical protein [Romboutsia weinsteinii]
MRIVDEEISILLAQFVDMINKEYIFIHSELELSFNSDLSSPEQAKHSEKLAEACKVSNDKIIRTRDELDDFFLN